jgi:hypothetical protein
MIGMEKVMVTFDVAAEDGSSYTDWEVEMPRDAADRLAAQVFESDPDEFFTFCKECPDGRGSACSHGAEHVRVLAVGNLRIDGRVPTT